MELTGDPTFRVWPLPYAAERQEPGIDGIYPQGPEIDSRTLFRIRLHCQFANPGSFTSVMFLSEGSWERLHIAIQNPTFDVTEIIQKTIKPEKFPEDWFPLFHFADLPEIFFKLQLDYKYLRIGSDRLDSKGLRPNEVRIGPNQSEIVYLNLNSLTEPVNHAEIYYRYGRELINFLKLVETRGLIKVPTNRIESFTSAWHLKPANADLLPEAVPYLENFNQLYLPTIPLTSEFLMARLNNEPYYYFIGCSPVYIHFLALVLKDLWLIEGYLELPMKSLSDYAQLKTLTSALLSASGSVFRKEADFEIPEDVLPPLSEAFYYLGPEKTPVKSFLYPVNQIPPELF
jgi:hypothetical protein